MTFVHLYIGSSLKLNYTVETDVALNMFSVAVLYIVWCNTLYCMVLMSVYALKLSLNRMLCVGFFCLTWGMMTAMRASSSQWRGSGFESVQPVNPRCPSLLSGIHDYAVELCE